MNDDAWDEDGPFALGRRADHPFVRVGPPARDVEASPLVVVTGLNDPLLRVTDTLWFAGCVASLGVRLRHRGYPGPVYLTSRPAGLPAGHTTRAMGADLARFLAGFDRPANLLGVSMGGFVAHHCAVDFPDRVERLVLGLAAARLSAHGRARVERWREWAARGEWGRIYRAGCDAVAVGPLRVAMRAATYPYDRLTGYPPAGLDFDVSAVACLGHDASERVPPVPTLVVGGTEDPFFTAAEFERTARPLGAPFERLDGLGHEAVVCAGERFDRPVLSFLTGPARTGRPSKRQR
ncbi:alpha/beta fold hydrolase [Halomarina oriensis]|uniref:alpha/beta fold hydrolase n=1 Tax=Halomarina oriensis TaxID=671145 RepID=UPI0018EEF1A8|nr:alpha/beta hydrolase [Halomarina oriensis]